MKTSFKMPNLTTVFFSLVILHLTLSVQCRTHRSSKFDGQVSDPIVSPNLETVPRKTLSSSIEYRIGDPNSVITAPRELSPKMEGAEPSEDHLAGRVPDSYRIIPRKPEPPRIEMQLIKGHVSRTGDWIVEYRFSDNYENDRSKSHDGISATSDKPQEQTTKKPKGGLGSRTIFEIPGRQCPQGYQLDYRKQCRKAVQFWYED
ncbi:uncharacterized protein LOC105662989 [Megachile rotundata]|uniref:uncharacterized protein LOC105662989 n=1 Tax=Megachile rotundata TaxID=143995 RepID=UPI003FD2B384